jgi:hypothetical protein
MKPQHKATLALPFAIATLVTILYFAVTYPAIFSWVLIIPAGVAILASIWYGLYRLFGGQD